MKLAVVSGASSGIGEACARLFVKHGYHVILLARSESKLNKIVAELVDLGFQASYEALDGADHMAIKEMAKRVLSRYGLPEVFVHAAGAGTWQFIEEAELGAAGQLMAAPYYSAFNLTQVFMAACLARRSGHHIFVGSPASIAPWPGATGYVAARFALRGLNEALNQDLAGTGVHASHIVFGKVSSAYFLHNPGSEEVIPAANRFAPTLTPEKCALLILKLVNRPKREVIYPWVIRLSFSFPWLIRWLGRKTGRRHQ